MVILRRSEVSHVIIVAMVEGAGVDFVIVVFAPVTVGTVRLGLVHVVRIMRMSRVLVGIGERWRIRVLGIGIEVGLLVI